VSSRKQKERSDMEKGDVRVDLDKLPIKRLEAIDEIGNEHYPP